MTEMTLWRFLTQSAFGPNLTFLLVALVSEKVVGFIQLTGPQQRAPVILGLQSKAKRLVTYHTTDRASAQKEFTSWLSFHVANCSIMQQIILMRSLHLT
jgi:hypothetical protein